MRSSPSPATIPRLAVILTLGVVGAVAFLAAAANGRLEWAPPQQYFPENYRTARVTCVSEDANSEHVRESALLDEFESDWYSQHLRAAREPSLYLASRAPEAERKLAYRFTWLRTFHRPVVVRIDETGAGAWRLQAKELSGAGGYDPGAIAKTVDRNLSPREVAALKTLIANTRLFDQPPLGCQEGTDGSRWIIEANDHGKYRYLNRFYPRGGPVRETGLLLLGFTGWTYKEMY